MNTNRLIHLIKELSRIVDEICLIAIEEDKDFQRSKIIESLLKEKEECHD